jgi:hypothetical protein
VLMARRCEAAYRAWWRSAPAGVKAAEKAAIIRYIVDFFLAVCTHTWPISCLPGVARISLTRTPFIAVILACETTFLTY